MSPPLRMKWKTALIAVVPILSLLITTIIILCWCKIRRRRDTVADVEVGDASNSTIYTLSPITPQRFVRRRDDENPHGISGDMLPSRHTSTENKVSSSSSTRTPSAENRPAEIGFSGIDLPAPQAGPRIACTKFEYDVLAKATWNFSRHRKLGQGSTGAVFKGQLLGDEGLEILVAVKRFHGSFHGEMHRQVLQDLRRRHPLRHRNLVHLLGYCLQEDSKLHLVYDFVENGSLDQHLKLFGAGEKSSPLSWARRYTIVVGIAAGLHHLHSHSSVHGSVKASNVLLDRDFTVRLGDFGYSRLSTSAPYVRPTYEQDILCFGALVLEVVYARRCRSDEIPGGFKSLVDWVWALHGQGRVLDAVAGADEDDKAVAEKMLVVGLACSHPDPRKRPKMEDVVQHMQSAGVPLMKVPLSKPQYDHAPAEPHARHGDVGASGIIPSFGSWDNVEGEADEPQRASYSFVFRASK